jgi:osmotically-inducible protein OsmY
MSSNPTPPALAHAFLTRPWNKMNSNELRSNLVQAFAEDPEIQDASNIAVNIKGDVGSDTTVELVGKVKSQLDASRAEQIVRVNTGGEAAIRNDLVIQ